MKVNNKVLCEIKEYLSRFIIKQGEWKIYMKIFMEKYNIGQTTMIKIFTGKYGVKK